MTAEIDAVLPLRREDFRRFERLLHPTLSQYLLCLGTCWIVTPDADFAYVATRCPSGNYEVLPETELCPDLTEYPRLGGWYRQQVVKLAASAVTETAFCLALDADVVCVRAATYEALIPGGKARMRAWADDPHPRWYADASRVLALARPARTYGVIPALFSRDATRLLFAHLALRSEEADGLCANAAVRRAGMRYLLASLPCTECALYGTFLDGTGTFDDFHVAGRYGLAGNCVWSPGDIASWDPRASFEAREDFWFSVLQSNTGDCDVAAVERLIARYLS